MSDSASIQLLRLPETGGNNGSSSNGKARGQTVNGKPLALDVSSLIGKPSTSSSSSNPDEAPLNLSMKTKEDSNTVMVDSLASASLEDKSLEETGTKAPPIIANSPEPFSSSSSLPLISPAFMQRPSSRVILFIH